MGKFDIQSYEDEFHRVIRSAFETGGPVLDVGCGREFGENQLEGHQISIPDEIDYLTIDVRPEPYPDLVADLSKLPVGDLKLSVVFIESVLEHVSPVSKVDDCIAEIYRTLADGGVVTGWVPFCYYFHGNGFPDGNRFTFDGVERILSDFDEVRIQPSGGPASIFLNSLGGAAKRIRRGGVGFRFFAKK